MRTILAGDTNIKTEVELVNLTTRDSRGQWGVQGNHQARDDFIIFRGFRGRKSTRHSIRTHQEYAIQDHCPVWVTLSEEAVEKPLYGRDARELAVGKTDVIARVTDPNLPPESRMTAEQAEKHFDTVMEALATQDQHNKAMSQQIEAQLLVEEKQETAAVDAGAVGSSGAAGPAAADQRVEGTGADDEPMDDEVPDWAEAPPSISPAPPSPGSSRASSRSRTPAPSRSPSPPPGFARNQAFRRAAVVVKVVSRACVVL